jgi:hypothetical protein
MSDLDSLLRDLWDNLLSGQPERVRTAFNSLDQNERQAVLAHLKDMVDGGGWQRVQRESAKAALRAINA